MEINRITNTYLKYRRKRNLILVLLILPTVILIASFVILYNVNLIGFSTLVPIYLVLAVLNLVFIALMQPRLVLYNMYTNYAYMVNEPRTPRYLKKEIMTQSWINSLYKKGYKLSMDNTNYMLFYQYVKKLPYGNKTDSMMVFVIIAKNDKLDFYTDSIDRDIQAAYLRDIKFQSVNKQVALQFKKFENFDESANKEIEKAIVYRAGKQIIVHLTVAYINSTKAIYSICPKKKFPNKFVYFACKEISRISGVKE